jgi:hypothetical protein
MAEIRNVSIKIEAAQSISIDLTGDLMETKLYSPGGTSLGTVRDLLFARWNEGALPSDAGTHERLEFIANPIYVASHGDFMKANIFATVEVAQRRYVGAFTPEQVAVLEGVAGAETEMPNIPRDWREIAAPEEDPDTQAVFTSVLQY